MCYYSKVKYIINTITANPAPNPPIPSSYKSVVYRLG